MQKGTKHVHMFEAIKKGAVKSEQKGKNQQIACYEIFNFIIYVIFSPNIMEAYVDYMHGGSKARFQIYK